VPTDDTNRIQTRVATRAAELGIALSVEASSALAGYYSLLMRWNRKLNLTGFGDNEGAIDRLLLEPACAVSYLPSKGRMLDIGSGGGSPAIPLKLLLPGFQLTMVEAKARKAAFLREAVRRLELHGSVVEHCRFQSLLADPLVRDAYDVVTIRAVRTDGEDLRMLRPLLHMTGWIMLFHGAESPHWPASESMTAALLRSTGSRLTIIPALALGGNVPRGTFRGV